MKATLVATALLFACSLGFGIRAQAQEAKEHSMTGCLEKGATEGTFQLTNVEKGPKTVEIAETTAKLAPHVGHKVEITGVKIAGADPKVHTMKVTGVKMLAATCP